ncbi:MAG: DUF4118 domain-containing protein [candidate division WOR-3 bacterium]
MIRFKKSSDLDVFFVFRWLVLLSIILIAGYATEDISRISYIFYFLTIMMASISSGLGASIAITLASVGSYVWLVQQTGTLSLQDPVFLLKLVFLLLTAFISSLWNKIMKERVETVRESEKREKQDIQQFYREVISSINAGIAVIEDVEGEIFTRLINPKAQELTKGNKNIVPILLNWQIDSSISPRPEKSTGNSQRLGADTYDVYQK